MSVAKPPLPPPDRQCTATCSRGRGDPDGRCTAWALPGEDVCYAHSGKGRIGVPPDERRCTARSKNRANKGERCPNWSMKGQTVCLRHGGGNTRSRKAAARRIAEAELTKQANRLLVQLGADPVDNPLTALAELAGEVRAFKNSLGTRVNALGEEIRYKGGAGEQLRAEVALYERAVSQFGTLLTNIARLNIDERLAAITEKQAETVMQAIRAV